ncbi:hypothetical protein [Ktedonospora formicarum]|uniref:Uncharacterized protein n=1 Tax=Ktedonospora formicarum TaxID=2778364 RepID=A0A8J3I570_9CHLR|nr:hypothetical protein [Ktedonospora formicarum]GHO47258.1 hypothetical protein KSX_54210 [Ktedonospora formicarum]
MDIISILNNPNGFATLAIPVLLVVLLLWAIFNALNSGWYKCNAPGCEFRTRDPEAAAGHTALHGMHKTVPED